MSDRGFDLNARARAKNIEKSKIRVGKKDLFDPIIEFFLKTGSDFIEVDVTGMDSNHLMTHLNKSIEEKSLEDRVRTLIKKNIVFLVLKKPSLEVGSSPSFILTSHICRFIKDNELCK